MFGHITVYTVLAFLSGWSHTYIDYKSICTKRIDKTKDSNFDKTHLLKPSKIKQQTSNIEIHSQKAYETHSYDQIEVDRTE